VFEKRTDVRSSTMRDGGFLQVKRRRGMLVTPSTQARIDRLDDLRWHTGPDADRCRYRTDDPEGIAGGEATIFRAVTADGQPVALKQLPSVDEKRRDRLIARSAEIASIEHPNIARHLETFLGPGLFRGATVPEEDCDVLYMAAQWAEGVPLSSLQEQLPPTDALTVLAQLADAVDHLHAADVTHRDLHPGNVILDGTRTTVIDLAHVRAVADTGSTVVFGAAGFVPPERFDDALVAEPAADRWQVAMLAVFLLLGRTRSRREPLRSLRQDLEQRLTGVVRRPGQSARLIVAMLADDPARRPTMPLREWVAEVAGSGHATRRRVLLSAAATVVAVGAVAGAVSALPLDGGKPKVAAAAAPTCRFAVGQADPTDPPSPARLAEITAMSGDVHICATTATYADGPMAVQEFGHQAWVGALVSSGTGRGFVLSPAQWAAYARTGDTRGSHASATAGPIIGTTQSAGDSEILTTHGRLVGTRTDSAHYFVTAQMQRVREANPALGMPTSDLQPAGDRQVQEFQHGVVTLGPRGAVQVRPIADPGAALPMVPLQDHLVRQADGTAWWVDAARTRHWLASGDEFACYGGSANLAVNEAVPSYAIATLAEAAPVHCPRSGG
jgi:hypothetical protein